MRNWLKDADGDKGKRVVVVHCKAGKGRSGTIATSYLVSQEGWKKEDALARFTARRMRPGFGAGVSIPSQLRWVNYVDTWSKTGRVYVERPIEIVEVHAWGLRDGVKVAVEGYVEEGRKIKTFYTFKKEERLIVDSPSSPLISPSSPRLTSPSGLLKASTTSKTDKLDSTSVKHVISDGSPLIDSNNQSLTPASKLERAGAEAGGKAVIFRPASTITLPSSDVCIDLERRNRAPYGWTMVTSVAHVWFNAFFEGLPPAHLIKGDATDQSSDSGVFEIEWEAMDGLKGSSKKGTRALDKLAVVWRVAQTSDDKKDQAEGLPPPKVITEPEPGAAVPETKAADWKGRDAKDDDTWEEKKLGLRVTSPTSKDVSRASSVKEAASGDESEGPAGGKKGVEDYEQEIAKVKTHGMDGEEESR